MGTVRPPRGTHSAKNDIISDHSKALPPLFHGLHRPISVRTCHGHTRVMRHFHGVYVRHTRLHSAEEQKGYVVDHRQNAGKLRGFRQARSIYQPNMGGAGHGSCEEAASWVSRLSSMTTFPSAAREGSWTTCARPPQDSTVVRRCPKLTASRVPVSKWLLPFHRL